MYNTNMLLKDSLNVISQQCSEKSSGYHRRKPERGGATFSRQSRLKAASLMHPIIIKGTVERTTKYYPVVLNSIKRAASSTSSK